MTYEADTDSVQNTQAGSESQNLYELSDEEMLALEAQQDTQNTVPTEEPQDAVVSGSENQEIDSNTQEPNLAVEEAAPVSWEEVMTRPFKANGRTMQVATPEEAIRLMQQGVGFNKKMETLKPYAGMVQTIKSEGITNEDLQLLIDAKKGNKAAIAQLMQSSGVDSYDLPDLEESPYVPQTEVASTAQAEFLEIASDIQSQPQGNQMLNVIAEWDDISTQEIFENPSLMYELYEDKKSGLFDFTLEVIQNDRALGRITPEWESRPFHELYNFVSEQLKSYAEQSQAAQTIPMRESLPMQRQEYQQIPVTAEIPQSDRGLQPARQQQQVSLDDIFGMSDDEFNKLKGN